MQALSGDCAGEPWATGEADIAGAFAIEVTLPADTTTLITAIAIDAAGNASVCSEPIVYVEDSTPPEPPTITGTEPPSRNGVTSVSFCL